MKNSFLSRIHYFKYITISIVVTWLILFAIIPQIAIVVVAFLKRSPQQFVEFTFSLEAFRRLLDPVLLKIIWDSLLLSFISTALCLLFGYPLAYGIATAKKQYRPMLLLLIIIPFWTNSVIRTYALILFLKKDGLLSGALEYFGIIDQPISLLYGNTAIFLGFLYTLLPFMVLPIYVAIDKLDQKLCDAARDLGASSFYTFVHIIIPLTMPGILAGCMLVFLPTLTYFFIPEILGGAKMVLIGNFIKNQFLLTQDWPLGAVACIILSLILFFLLFLYKKSERYIAAQNTKKRGTI
ncbi:MAG: ABC transporter permease [Desulfovibrionaceae bacterium]